MRFVTKQKFDASGCALSAKQRITLDHLSETARRLDARLAIPATSGNFSARCDEQEIFVSRSGLHKRDLEPRHFLRVNVKTGAPRPFSPRPSDETEVHRSLYSLYPNLNAILHCHAAEIERIVSPGTLFPGHELLKVLGWQTHTSDFFLNAFPNTQDMTQLGRDVTRVASGSPESSSLFYGIFVLQNHGIYCGGTSVKNAEARLEAILHLLRILK